MTTSISAVAPLRAALDALADAVEALRFDFPAREQRARRELGASVAGSIRRYLLPRLGDLEAPAVAVLLGSTGSGKSTLMNTLIEDAVSKVGAVRPTTTTPIVLSHPSNEDHHRRGTLDALTGRTAEIVTQADHLLRGVTLIDSPDFDSVRIENREIAEALLTQADLCVFVTSAQRYADAVPWEFLHKARARELPLFFVLNRVPPEDEAEIVADFTARLRDRDVLDGSPVLVVLEQVTDPGHGGLASPAALAPLRARLESLGDPQRRTALIRAATQGAVDAAVRSAAELVAFAGREREEGAALLAVAHRAYEDQERELDQQVREGTIIRGEIASRWQELVGGGQLVQAVGEGASRVGNWLRRVFGGEVQPARVQREARGELAGAVVRRADRAAAATAEAWRLDDAGEVLLDATGEELWGHGAATPGIAEASIEAWMAGVAELVASEGAGRKRLARVASYGVNAVAVTLMVTAFLHTGGLTGAEVGVAAGAAAAQQTLLELIFGKAAAATLIGRAREELLVALEGILDADRGRFAAVVEPLLTSPQTAIAVEAGAAAVSEAAGEFYR